MDGLPGFEGRPGVDGLPGPKGESGLPGQRGISGEPGRDGQYLLYDLHTENKLDFRYYILIA